MLYILKSLYDLPEYFRFSPQLFNIIKKVVFKSSDLRNHYFEVFDLMSWFAIWGQKEGGIYLGKPSKKKKNVNFFQKGGGVHPKVHIVGIEFLIDWK